MPVTPYFRNLLLALPFTVLTLVPFLFLSRLLGAPFKLHLIALGALGWWLALLLRIPIMLLAKNMASEKGRTVIALSSGPAEEITRLVLLLILGLTIENGYMIGLGWAAIEVIYSLIQGIGMGMLEQKTDPKAQEAKAMMKTMGMDKAMSPTAPFWGILERLSADALHIGFSLLLVISPYLALLTAPLHSFINILLTKLVRRSLFTAEIAVAALAATVFAVALLLTL